MFSTIPFQDRLCNPIAWHLPTKWNSTNMKSRQDAIKHFIHIYIYNPLIVCALQSLPAIGFAQAYPTFGHPLSLPPEVAGNFMELRTNHFHSGLDLKTNGRIGQPVMAPADGWVSRINISPVGYGKAVYISHPSGYTTVYGHLDRLNGKLATTLLDLQYAAREFSIDKSFQPGELPVKQGDIIAYSGNTGGSTAPHLHYEVRRTSDQHALDPQAFGVNVPDNVPPTIYGIRIDALDSLARTSPLPAGAHGFNTTATTDSTFVLKPGAKVSALGTVGISVNAIDRYTNSANICGIRALSVAVDGKAVCVIKLDEVDFGVQRYCNAYMDYRLFKGGKMHYNRCYKLPNNRLQLYTPETAPGRITLEPGKDHAVQVVATDASGNRSTLHFTLHGATAEEAARWPAPRPKGRLYQYANPNLIEEPGMRFSLPPNALYQDTYLVTNTAPVPEGALAPLFRVQDELTPIQLSSEITLDVTGKYPAGQDAKLLIVRRSGGKSVPEGGIFKGGKITTSVRSLGEFTVMIDTVPPVVTPIGLAADMKGKRSFRVRVTDNLSGVDKWAAKLDGKWILMEYEPKAHTLQHTFDKYSDLPGTHTFELEVTDERGNRSRLTRRFTR